MAKILEVKNLCKEYSGFKLNNISFSLESGFVMGFIGPNGAGKSTTIKLIMNLIKKTSGQVKIFGKDNVEYNKEIKQRVGFVYDENYYYGMMNIKETERIIAPFYKYWNSKQFSDYIKQFNLDPKKKIDSLSKGMKMKLSLAVALSHGADLIVMDEPTSGLDPIFRSEMLDILYNIIQDEKKSIFFSTHITTDLEKIADYITFINKGDLIFTKPKDQLLDSYCIVKGANELLDNDIEKEFIGIRKHGAGFEALSCNIEKTRNVFKDSVLIERASLEDIMLYSVRGSK